MQITLKVKENAVEKVLSFLKEYKDDITIIQQEENPSPETEDLYFHERQKDLQETLSAVESGKMPVYDFNKSMQKLIEELKN